MTKSANYELPILLKITLSIVGLIGLFFILVIGKAIILPFLFALLLAMLLNPVVNFLIRHKFNRVLAIAIMVIVMILFFFGLVYFITSQMAKLQESMPAMKEKFTMLYGDALDWGAQKLNISEKKIEGWIADSKKNWMDNSSTSIGQAFLTIGELVAVFFLIPIYVFMLLYYKPLLLEFVGRLFQNARQSAVTDVLNETKKLIQNYLVGLMTEVGIVTVMNISALLILGVQYALLLGVVAALLNLIPYVGILIATLLPIMIVLATKPPIYVLFVIIAYVVIQFVDNNFILPKIVGSHVKVNALVAIMVVLIGGALWGVPGMFLALPLTAIVKVIFDRIEALQAWGFLMGDTMPPMGHSVLKRRKAKAAAK